MNDGMGRCTFEISLHCKVNVPLRMPGSFHGEHVHHELRSAAIATDTKSLRSWESGISLVNACDYPDATYLTLEILHHVEGRRVAGGDCPTEWGLYVSAEQPQIGAVCYVWRDR